MAWSILSRRQALVTSGDPAQLLPSGFTQRTFAKIGRQYPDDRYRGLYAAYVREIAIHALEALSDAEKVRSFPLDRLSLGNGMLDTFSRSRDERFRRASDVLRDSIDTQPRNEAGGLWYWTAQPSISNLEGVYSLAPFYAQHAIYHDPGNVTAVVADIVKQFDLLWENCYDEKTGLLVHGYDASKKASWANQKTGASQYVWARAVGLYTMALIDTLEVLALSRVSLSATTLEGWPSMQKKFKMIGDALLKNVEYSGGWWQVMNEPSRKGNYIEPSATAMFVYSLLKGNRLGYFDDNAFPTDKIDTTRNLTTKYSEVALKAYDLLVKDYVVETQNRSLDFKGSSPTYSLNSAASYEYYLSQPSEYNSPFGTSAFVLASLEYERFYNVTSSIPWAPL
ncbi:cell wall glycosyl hydrolase [Moniliophthora roreri]|uniref:Cell wall glycosyl hydrolase n=1 Tax=Moniliophthora roreri TaxID=221103 RepID=A0A0W0FIQ5_MONRR|nr:cell wall glycosyl hydrolase [Moniliophthora roreri]